MNILDQILNNKDNQIIFKLRRGEMLLINNQYILHARKSFKDSENAGSRRLMIRLWGNEK